MGISVFNQVAGKVFGNAANPKRLVRIQRDKAV
jgi:hypothetical protein